MSQDTQPPLPFEEPPLPTVPAPWNTEQVNQVWDWGRWIRQALADARTGRVTVEAELAAVRRERDAAAEQVRRLQESVAGYRAWIERPREGQDVHQPGSTVLFEVTQAGPGGWVTFTARGRVAQVILGEGTVAYAVEWVTLAGVPASLTLPAARVRPDTSDTLPHPLDR